MVSSSSKYTASMIERNSDGMRTVTGHLSSIFNLLSTHPGRSITVKLEKFISNQGLPTHGTLEFPDKKWEWSVNVKVILMSILFAFTGQCLTGFSTFSGESIVW